MGNNMSLNEPIRYLFTLKSVFSTKIHRSVYLVLRGLWWVMASFDRRLYTDLQDIRASLYTALVPVDSGALLLALNVIVCSEWSGEECLMKRIIAGSRVHTCQSPGAQWACLCDGHQPPGGDRCSVSCLPMLHISLLAQTEQQLPKQRGLITLFSPTLALCSQAQADSHVWQ